MMRTLQVVLVFWMTMILSFPAGWSGFEFDRASMALESDGQDQDAAETSTESSSNLSEAGKAFERWERILMDAKYARVELTCSRISYRADDENAITSEILARQDVSAKSMMSTDSHFLAVWETNEHGEKAPSRPVLTLSFVDGEIHERLLVPGVGQYRNQRYPAPSPSGADDTEYVNGCQVGTLLETWVGESNMVQTSIRLLKTGEYGDLSILGDQDPSIPAGWIAVRVDDKYPVRDPETGELRYELVDDYWFDESGVLRRRRTTVYQGMLDDPFTADYRLVKEPYYIVQDRRYEFHFMNEAPKGLTETMQRLLDEREQNEINPIEYQVKEDQEK